ncbi:hypothetical protein L1987_21334 [Smallanthus sonchifolius]|uniref:Uncharacterized protein n=1 Tax=Smallanthus sonchifolius TaxID=185202 RepID=A0ACB9IVR8_9ASTR|nr:hypothetical protein L1987_21334 [Smallanthus sonchifolius]
MIKRRWEDERGVETLGMANYLMLLSRVGQSRSLTDRFFNCKTCNKEFKSFQALGGHRASHKRTKTTNGNAIETSPKPRTHECPVCGMGFAVGQALGGHMRRHRDGGNYEKGGVTEKRGLCMDLNLTPYENNLKLWDCS